jgi:outer membrane receptor protein involved in Fe transport
MRNCFRWCVLLAGLAVLNPENATAQEVRSESPPELVFAVSRYAQLLSDAPASVSVITREEIDRFGWCTIGEILSAARGIFVSYDRNYQYATVRGLARLGDFNTRVLLLLNGRRLSGGFEEGALIGTEAAIDVGAIERVEIIHGPGSAMFGTNAFYAVVNLVTRAGRTQPGVAVEVGAASFHTWNGSVAFGHRTDGVDLFGLASAMKSAGPDLYYREYDDSTSNNGRAVGVDGDEVVRGYARLGLGELTLEAAASSRTKETPTGSYETIFNDPRARLRDRVTMASASWEHALADLSRVWASATYHKADYDGWYPYESALVRDYGEAQSWTLEGQYQRYFGRHSGTFGGEIRRISKVTLGVFDEDPYFSYLDGRHSSRTWAVFGQGELKIGSIGTLVAGVRHDWYSTFGGTTSPRFALVLKLGERDTVKALYNRAFRAPSPNELYYHDGNMTQKRPEKLEPERTDTFELVWERPVGRGLAAVVSLYRVQVRDLMAMTIDPSDDLMVFSNLDRVRSTGVELECRGQIAGWINVRASYAFQDAEDRGTGEAPAGSPRHLGRVGLTTGIPKVGGSAALELRYVGERPTRDGTEVGGYTLINALVRAHLLRSDILEVCAGVDNMLDANWGTVGGDEHKQLEIPMDGRTFRLGLRARFGGRTP